MTAPAWNNRNFPYPVLSPTSDDYRPGITFEANIPEDQQNNGREIILEVEYQTNSQILNQLISEGKAHYCLLTDCTTTKRRETHSGTDTEQTIKLRTSDYYGPLIAMPYITATQTVKGFASEEHNEEYVMVKPAGFDLPRGAILAIGHGQHISPRDAENAYSIIDLVCDESLKPGEPPQIETDHDRIRIRMSLESKAQIEAIRRHRDNMNHPHMAGLFSSLYMPAIATGLIRMNESTNSWSASLRQMLDDKKISVEKAAEDPIHCAQLLLDNPTDRFIKTFSNTQRNE